MALCKMSGFLILKDGVAVMILAGFLFLLFISDGVSFETNCSYQDVLNYLNLTRNNELYSMTRPVKNYKRPTLVTLEVLLYAILDVVEKDQKFIPYVWTVMRFHNEYISWDPNQFCGIENVSVPAEILWKPDLAIEEMTEKDKAPPSPYLTINNKGEVEIQNDQVLVSTCRMHIFTFPFDIQRCNLSFKSVIHTARDIRLQPSDNSSEATEWSRDLMRTQYEWLFINMKVTAINASNSGDQDTIIYTVSVIAYFTQIYSNKCILVFSNLILQINMKRRPLLYIVNFLLPVLFFLCLDMSSFMISDRGGEKLSFKVTVLLAITVLQLILNDILPSSTDRVPLIAVYCIGIFGLMMLSLLETIFVMYLIEKDSQGSETDRDQSLRKESIKDNNGTFHSCHTEVQKRTQSGCIYELSAVESPSELLSAFKEGNSSKQTEDQTLERLSDELRKMEKTLSLILKTQKEEEKLGYWTRVAKRVNKYFLIFYVTVSILFLLVIYLQWNNV
ncbi:5-hydroxytryptamine receptor 3A-like [Leuresthes tenuis]|uniref:5-hydroxytryptamine receptor 3A-like n=1 Tax=Leuresthes tenuis TaxID=355514 RepID=UPI003B50D1FA